MEWQTVLNWKQLLELVRMNKGRGGQRENRAHELEIWSWNAKLWFGVTYKPATIDVILFGCCNIYDLPAAYFLSVQMCTGLGFLSYFICIKPSIPHSKQGSLASLHIPAFCRDPRSIPAALCIAHRAQQMKKNGMKENCVEATWQSLFRGHENSHWWWWCLLI